MWKKVQYKLVFSAPLIMHNGQLADPTNRWVKDLNRITSKRKKTDADHEEISRLQFFGGIYMTPDGPAIPSECIEATLVNAAKRQKQGLTAKSGMFCDEHAQLEYDGPRTVEELWKEERFRLTNLVSVNKGSKVLRTRPIFRNWSTAITVTFDDEQANLSGVDEWVKIGGQVIGLLDWRPKYGRYEAKRID